MFIEQAFDNQRVTASVNNVNNKYLKLIHRYKDYRITYCVSAIYISLYAYIGAFVYFVYFLR